MPSQSGFWNWFFWKKRPASDVEAPSYVVPRQMAIDPRLTRSNASSQFLPLPFVVEQFNALAAENDVGRHQPPLTVAEVATAIRSAGRHQLPLLESQRRQIHSIAEFQQLPIEASLRFTTVWFAPSGYRCEVWWIDLIICFPDQGGDPLPQSAACCLRIRDHRLRSWRDESVSVLNEIQRLQADHRWYTASLAHIELSINK